MLLINESCVGSSFLKTEVKHSNTPASEIFGCANISLKYTSSTEMVKVNIFERMDLDF